MAWRVAAALSGVLLVLGALLAAGGRIDVYDSAGGAPAWAAPCFRHDPRTDRELLDFCSRVEGRVLLVRHKREPRETHVALLARFHLFVVKLPAAMPAPPIGSRIAAVGPLVRASNGQREVQAWVVARR
jgi:hypothetical protein